jgi:transcriptional regulator with XRE-family HTH domain
LIYTKDKDYLLLFGKHLKKMREGKGMSQEELANLAEVSLPQITRIERGVINPTICTIKSLAKGLEVGTALLFSFELSQTSEK